MESTIYHLSSVQQQKEDQDNAQHNDFFHDLYVDPSLSSLSNPFILVSPSSIPVQPSSAAELQTGEAPLQWYNASQEAHSTYAHFEPNHFHLNAPCDLDYLPTSTYTFEDSTSCYSDYSNSIVHSPSPSPSLPSSLQSDTDQSASSPPNNVSSSERAISNPDGTWSCGFPDCKSRVAFRRRCDLRKHYKRHFRTLYCRYPNCPRARLDEGFGTEKDRSRHEQKHAPRVKCDWDGCERVFSRTDNMRDHVRRVHLGATTPRS